VLQHTRPSIEVADVWLGLVLDTVCAGPSWRHPHDVTKFFHSGEPASDAARHAVCLTLHVLHLSLGEDSQRVGEAQLLG